MQYIGVAESDIGTAREKNQDSILYRHALYGDKEIVMAIVCDGMGGLSDGEVASAVVIDAFEKWFSNSLQIELEDLNMCVIAGKWSLLLKTLNMELKAYGQTTGRRMGTTFTGTLFVNDQYVIVHVGDSGMYYVGSSLTQLTVDHTYVAREISKGILMPEQAKTSKYRNVLLQCIGASKIVEPQIICGKMKPGFYLLCSDGFRHVLLEEEICGALNYENLFCRQLMQKECRRLIDLIKCRQERDNISVILIRASKEQQAEKDRSSVESTHYNKGKNGLWDRILLCTGIILMICGLLLMHF